MLRMTFYERFGRAWL